VGANDGVSFYSPTKLYFTQNQVDLIADKIAPFGSRFLLLNIRKESYNPNLLKNLQSRLNTFGNGSIIHEDLLGNPDTEQLDSVTYFAKRSHIDCVVAFGGIDTVNTAKAVALLVTNSFFAEELFTQNPSSVIPPLPVVTVPMEPCLGEEVSGYFSLVDAQNNIRKTFASDQVFPAACIVDTALNSHMKGEDMARIGGALMATAIEKYVSGDLNLITETLLLKGIRNLYQELPVAYKDPTNERARELISWASLMTGSSIMDKPNGINWVFAHVLSTRTRIKFHQALSLLIPYIMEFYLTTLSKRYVDLSRALGIQTSDLSVVEAAIHTIEEIRSFYSKLNLPTQLGEFYISRDMLPAIISDIEKFPELENSPRKLNAQEIESILLTAL